ncbi:MAG TPA: Stk1 family PASTA domain-containing Ser/Thr kinase [Solirubrobacteraceae bacterium]|nr:Stk1 family PASTA domain-containing Ser/Thr kinase [Solirubrobacteraceae bacterium]
MSDFESGAIIDGRYRVLSRVGAGGMADVYLARDEQLGREVALKLLHRRFAEDPDFVERFRREAQAAASLSHPNVVSVFDRGEFDGTYYIAMEYLSGRSLKQLIRDEAPLEPGRAVDLAVQILKAARFAHRRGVIHRDIKPHNVIVDDNDHAKVTDFGIARAGASDMTETGSIMGTAQYLSPEQAQGHTVSAPSDLYSVAVVLYEMLTARVPFDGDSAVTIALKHVSEAPIPPSQINPAVGPALDQVVMWALNKDPADRPADADQFITALEQVRGAVVGPVGEITASMQVVPVAAAVGSPRTTVLPPAEALGVYGNTGLHAVDGERVNRYDDDQEDKDAGIWPWLVGVLVLLLIAGGVTAFLLTRPKSVQMPDVVGLLQPVAQAKVQNLGLNPIIDNETSSQPVNSVISQSPLAGANVKKGATVTLTVSTGAGNVQIPSVVSLPQKQAIQALKAAGLSVTRILQQTSTDVDKGQAIDTSPDAGTSVSRGSGVTLVVSSGMQLPDVSGLSYQQAQQALTNFTVTTVPQTSTTAQPGTVLSQNPPPSTPVAAGSKVTLTVAQAPTTASVPSVLGYTAAGAVATLSSAGFQVTQKLRTTTSASQVGDVIAQNPKGNSTAKKNATVTIWIGKAAPTKTTTNPSTVIPPPAQTSTTPTTTTTTTTSATTTTSTQPTSTT